MVSITIRQLDERVKTRLRVRAARHGRSMEEEARQILKAGVEEQATSRPNLAQSIRLLMDPLGGVELDIPPRGPIRKPPKLT